MPNNRAIQVRMVKTTQDGEAEPNTEDDFTDKLYITSEVVTDVIREGFKFVVGYVVVDTCRKVIVALASK